MLHLVTSEPSIHTSHARFSFNCARVGCLDYSDTPCCAAVICILTCRKARKHRGALLSHGECCLPFSAHAQVQCVSVTAVGAEKPKYTDRGASDRRKTADTHRYTDTPIEGPGAGDRRKPPDIVCTWHRCQLTGGTPA